MQTRRVRILELNRATPPPTSRAPRMVPFDCTAVGHGNIGRRSRGDHLHAQPAEGQVPHSRRVLFANHRTRTRSVVVQVWSRYLSWCLLLWGALGSWHRPNRAIFQRSSIYGTAVHLAYGHLFQIFACMSQPLIWKTQRCDHHPFSVALGWRPAGDMFYDVLWGLDFAAPRTNLFLGFGRLSAE